MALDATSMQRLSGVHQNLVTVLTIAAERPPFPFIITEGMRTQERQRQLVQAGASWTMRSRHLTGHAADVAPMIDGQVRWDWPLFDRLAAHILAVAATIDISVEWGGTWRTHPDGPHFQLNWEDYP